MITVFRICDKPKNCTVISKETNWTYPSFYCVFQRLLLQRVVQYEVLSEPDLCRHTSNWLSILRCIYQNNGNHTRAVFVSCFILESCKHRVGKIRTLLRESGSAESLRLQRALLAMEGSAPLFVIILFTKPSFFEGLVLRLVVSCPAMCTM